MPLCTNPPVPVSPAPANAGNVSLAYRISALRKTMPDNISSLTSSVLNFLSTSVRVSPGKPLPFETHRCARAIYSSLARKRLLALSLESEFREECKKIPDYLPELQDERMEGLHIALELVQYIMKLEELMIAMVRFDQDLVGGNRHGLESEGVLGLEEEETW